MKGPEIKRFKTMNITDYKNPGCVIYTNSTRDLLTPRYANVIDFLFNKENVT